MSFELDWAAPILPGHSTMGFVLGATQHEVLEALRSHSLGDGSDLIAFRNSPKLLVDTTKRVLSI